MRPNTNIFGSMVVMRCPRSAPPIPAMKLETTKLTILTCATSMPIERAAISSSRTALSERPYAERMSANMKMIDSAAKDQTTQVVEYFGKPLSPSAPFVSPCAFVMSTRMISAKPRVAIAR